MPCRPGSTTPPLPGFVNKVLLVHSHTHSFVLPRAAFTLQWQSWIVKTETTWAAESKIFTILSFSENSFDCPCPRWWCGWLYLVAQKRFPSYVTSKEKPSLTTQSKVASCHKSPHPALLSLLHLVYSFTHLLSCQLTPLFRICTPGELWHSKSYL